MPDSCSTAAIIRPQLRGLSAKITKLNQNYDALRSHLERVTPTG